jgi:hypothetical protein
LTEGATKEWAKRAILSGRFVGGVAGWTSVENRRINGWPGVNAAAAGCSGAQDIEVEGVKGARLALLFRGEPDEETISDIRLALNQNQPLGNARFLNRVAKVAGERREARPRGRPRKSGAGGEGGTPGVGAGLARHQTEKRHLIRI